MRLRLLPLIVFASVMLLALKAADIVERRQSFSEAFLAATSVAQEHPKDDNSTEDTKEDVGKKNTKDDHNTGEPQPNEENVEFHEESAESKFTKTEIDILQRLAERSEKLDKWKNEIGIKESILDITQTKIDQKIAELRVLKRQVEKILDQYNDKENTKINRLVKIYESMKAKDASEIFEKMDMATILLIVEKMKEKNIALIMAKMKPELAKEISENFTIFRKLPDPEKK